MRNGWIVLLAVTLWGCEESANEGKSNAPGANEPSGTTGDGSATSVSGLAASIDRVGLDINGALEVEPILLLKGGVACDCLDEAIDTVTVDELETRRPKVIGEWRVEGNETQVKFARRGTGWDKLAFRASGLPLGDEFRSSLSFDRTSTMGAPGTGSFVGASKRITFDANGRFKFVGAATTSNSAGTSESAGTYTVSGWMMTFTFDDGRTWNVSAITGSDAPGKILWLSGAAYSSR